jgi:hypothetical protein
VRTYVVQPGDSPARIAIQFAGCPRCAIDLTTSNPHKPTVIHPNGFKTFRDLRVGETLSLPDKWFSEEFDRLPPSYFARLPHSDGVTPGAVGDSTDPASPPSGGYAPVVVIPAFPSAVVSAAQAAASALGADPNYCASVRQAGSAVNAAVHAFKTAWNSSQSAPVPIGTSNYEAPTADALMQVIGSAPPACSAAPPPAPAPIPYVPPPPRPGSAAQPPGLSAASVVGIGLFGAAAVGGAAYMILHGRGRKRSVRRGRRR